MRNFSDYDGLALFVRTVQAGSLAAAERALGVPKATLSRRLTMLEEQLDLKLARRTKKGLILTEQGQRLFERGLVALSATDEVIAELRDGQEAMSGTVRLSLPPDIAMIALAPALIRFKAKHPKVTLDLTLSDRRVSLIEEGFDLVVRMGELEDSGLVARRIARIPRMLVASPDFLARQDVIESPENLRKLPALAIRQDIGEWELRNTRDEVVRVRPSITFAANRQTILVEAAVAGLGIANLPLILMADQLRAGTLVEVLPGWTPQQVTMTALWHRDRITARLVRAIVDDFVALFAGAAGP